METQISADILSTDKSVRTNRVDIRQAFAIAAATTVAVLGVGAIIAFTTVAMAPGVAGTAAGNFIGYALGFPVGKLAIATYNKFSRSQR